MELWGAFEERLLTRELLLELWAGAGEKPSRELGRTLEDGPDIEELPRELRGALKPAGEAGGDVAGTVLKFKASELSGASQHLAEHCPHPKKKITLHLNTH